MINAGWRRFVMAAACIGVCFLPGIFGGRFAPGQWYQALEKPLLTPPGWAFPVAWTILYLTMGISLFMILRTKRPLASKTALPAFALQLVLNGLWSWIFFGLQRPGLAFAEILVLWLTIVFSAVQFSKIRRAAGLLLLPYIGWVAFAAWLNFALWRLNL